MNREEIKDARAALTAAVDQLDMAARDRLLRATPEDLHEVARSVGLDPIGERHDRLVNLILDRLAQDASSGSAA